METDHTRRQKSEAVLTWASCPVTCSPLLSTPGLQGRDKPLLQEGECLLASPLTPSIPAGSDHRNPVIQPLPISSPSSTGTYTDPSFPEPNIPHVLFSPGLQTPVAQDILTSVFTRKNLTSSGSLINHSPKPKGASLSRPHRQDLAWPMFRD